MTDRLAFQKSVSDRADQALAHPIVESVMAELRGNLGVPDDGLPAYGIVKVAHYAASVAIAQTVGVDPDLLRMNADEASAEVLRIAAEMVGHGIPVVTVDGQHHKETL